jgi:hypothetical protein
MAGATVLPATDAAGAGSVIVIDALVVERGIKSFKKVGKI